MMVNIESINLNELLDEIRAIILPLAQKQKNKFYITFDSAHTEIKSDPIKLRQIIFNLVSNACKFSENSIISLSVRYAMIDNKKHYQFIIKDNGIGMSKEEISQIFNPFVQADNSLTKSYGGTGLGLSITNRFVEMLGGKITVESTPGEGSTFTVLLPEKIQVTDNAEKEQLSV